MEIKKIPVIGKSLSKLDEEDIGYGAVVAVVGLLIIFVGLGYAGVSQAKMVTFMFLSAPVWLPYLSFKIFFDKYMEMVGKKFALNNGRTVCEIKLPADVFKSPEAMEFVFTQIYNAASPDNLMETYLDGKRPLPYSFELVSRGGDVHFYMTLPNKFVNGLTDNLYAQYPGVEVIRQPVDYTAEVPHDLKNWSFISFHFGKKEDEEFPIKTYREYGMEKLPKEEEKVDPMTPMLEMLAGIKPHHQVWIQFICIAHRKKTFKFGQLKAEGTWEKRIQAKIDEILGRDKDKKANIELEGMVKLTTGERDTVDTMERIAGQYAFSVACRACYISNKPSDYDSALFSRLINSFRSTEIKNRNGLGVRWRADFNYKFISDPFGKRLPAIKKQELSEYKKRVLYDKGGTSVFKLFSTEELATLFHLPGKVALTTTLNRVPSTRGEAPSNLPTGNLPI